MEWSPSPACGRTKRSITPSISNPIQRVASNSKLQFRCVPHSNDHFQCASKLSQVIHCSTDLSPSTRKSISLDRETTPFAEYSSITFTHSKGVPCYDTCISRL